MGVGAGQTACVILARGGSKGIPGKNLAPIGGVSLIARSVRAGMKAAGVGAVYVSTDDAAIAAEAARFGARIIHRPAELADSQASSESGWLHALATIRQDIPDLSRLVMLQCTSPFTTGADIDACLDRMDALGADCALSVMEDHSFLWTLDAQGFGVGMTHDHKAQRQRRQDLPPQYRESGAIYAVNVAAFERVGRRFCGKVALVEVNHPALEIDVPADLALARQIAANAMHGGPSRRQLAAVQALVMDFDGVHTDNRVVVHQDGTESVTASRGDGMGLSELRKQRDLPMLILSKERNHVVLARGRKLGIEVLHSVDDKVSALNEWLAERSIGWEALLYVGNDINDAEAMQRAGLAACPSDAHASILSTADWVLPAPGGGGALRALCDALMSAGKSQADGSLK